MSKKFDDYISKFKPFATSKLSPTVQDDDAEIPEIRAVNRFLREELDDDWATMGAMTMCGILMLRGITYATAEQELRIADQLKALLAYLSSKVATLVTPDVKLGAVSKASLIQHGEEIAKTCKREVKELTAPFAAGLPANDFTAVLAELHIRTILQTFYSIKLGLVALKCTTAEAENTSVPRQELEAMINATLAEHFTRQFIRWSNMESMLNLVFEMKLPHIDTLTEILTQARKRYEHLLSEGLDVPHAITESLTLAGKFLVDKVSKARQHVARENEGNTPGKTFDFGSGLN